MVSVDTAKTQASGVVYLLARSQDRHMKLSAVVLRRFAALLASIVLHAAVAVEDLGTGGHRRYGAPSYPVEQREEGIADVRITGGYYGDGASATTYNDRGGRDGGLRRGLKGSKTSKSERGERKRSKKKGRQDSSDSGDEGGEGGQPEGDDGPLFTPAQPLEFFKNGIDRDVFEWIRKDEVEAGGTTCGWLKADLGVATSKSDEVFPKVKVYFCMQFADVQPA